MDNLINYGFDTVEPITVTTKEQTIPHEKIESFKKTILFRLGGMFLLFLTIIAIKYDWFYDYTTNSTDITFTFITVPLGLMYMFCPINACDDIEEEESEGYYDEE